MTDPRKPVEIVTRPGGPSDPWTTLIQNGDQTEIWLNDYEADLRLLSDAISFISTLAFHDAINPHNSYMFSIIVP